MRKYIVWISCVWLLSSACATNTIATPTQLPTATPNVGVTAAIETTTPIATLTPSAVTVPTATMQVIDTVDALASQTDEGYYQIGNANAPITLVDYSDFF